MKLITIAIQNQNRLKASVGDIVAFVFPYLLTAD